MPQMTHYMELLASNQPWNLIVFMAIPVILAETLVATEFFVVFRHLTSGSLRKFNRWVGIILGFYFAYIFLKLVITVVPSIEWRGWVDVVAVGFYLSGVVPLFTIALLELGAVGRGLDESGKMKAHFIALTVFLVVAHIAMIFGMVNPEILSSMADMKM